jgi:hypothetical protein
LIGAEAESALARIVVAPSARFAHVLTFAVAILALIAAAAGLFIPGLYREGPVAPAMRGQDVVTLFAMCVLVALSIARMNEAPRATIMKIGLLGYALYVGIGAAFAYRFNELFLVYVALFSASLFGLILTLTELDVARLRQSFDAGTPRIPVAAFLVGVALILAVSELGQIVTALITRSVPDLLVRSDGSGNFVFALDLGLVMPLALVAAFLLLGGTGWGFVLAGALLIKAHTMGLALLCGTWFAVRAGLGLEPGLTVAYGVVALGSLAMTLVFFRHCRGVTNDRPQSKRY